MTKIFSAYVKTTCWWNSSRLKNCKQLQAAELTCMDLQLGAERDAISNNVVERAGGDGKWVRSADRKPTVGNGILVQQIQVHTNKFAYFI